MEGCYCPVLSGKQTVDLHLSQRSHAMVLPSRNGRWQLLPHAHPLYQGAQGLGLSYWLFSQALLLLTCSKIPPLNHSLLSSHWLWKPGHCMPLDSFQEIFKHHLVLTVWGRKQVLYIHFLVEMEIPAQSKLWWWLDGLVLGSEYYCLPVVLQADHSDNHQQRDESSNVKTHSMHLCPRRVSTYLLEMGWASSEQVYFGICIVSQLYQVVSCLK